jgi:hypothetical protein
MIPIFNSQGQQEFNLVLGRKILRCCFQILKAFKTSVSAIEIHQKKSEKYSNLADFIENVFYRHYQAKIKISAPKIMAVIDQNGLAVSALAIRSAFEEKLFLEQYLDRNIEEILSEKFHRKVSRKEIAEIGSLASRKKHAARFLYVALASYLKARGYKYVVATGTKYLYDYFEKAQLKPQIIAKALQSKLLDQSVNWGSYYDSNPQVMVIDVERGNMMLGGFLGIMAVPCMNSLYPPISYVHEQFQNSCPNSPKC